MKNRQQKGDCLYYFKRFSNWNDAEHYCESIEGGYSSEHILEAVVKANNEVLNGNALYE